MPEPDVLQLLCEPFGLRADRLRRIACSQNEVFECRDGEDRSIFRVSHGRGRTPGEVEAEIAWMTDLADRGVDVCRPRVSRAGRRCERRIISDVEYLVAHFDHAPGRKFGPADRDESLYARLGALTARLHSASFDTATPAKDLYPRPMWYASRLLTDDLDRFTPAEDHAFRAAVRDLTADLKRRTDGDLGLIHADVSFTNTFLDEASPDGPRLWVFDFDNCEVGSVVQDLATIVYDATYCHLLNRVPPADLGMMVRRRWDALLEGYRAVRHLGPIDAELMRRFLVLREAVIYTHYCRILDRAKLSDTFREGMNRMRRNVERGVTEVDLAYECAPQR